MIVEFILRDSYPDLPKELKSFRYIGNSIVSLLIYFILNESLNRYLTIFGMFWIILKITWCRHIAN